jgi:hypothetical protein
LNKNNFPRLSAFFSEAGTIEVIAPAEATHSPNYTRHFATGTAKSVIAGLALSSALAIAPGDATAQPVRTAPDVTVDQHESKRAMLLNVRGVYEKYSSHGHVAHNVYLGVRSADSPEKGLPFAGKGAIDKDSCVILEIRPDYEKVFAANNMKNYLHTEDMRTATLIHEDMHCRTAGVIALMNEDIELAKKGEITFPQQEFAENYSRLVMESSADAASILMIARRDGKERALETWDHEMRMRTELNAHSEENFTHDTRATLLKVKEVLEKEPEKYANDAVAFTTAIELGAQGAASSFPGFLNREELELTQTTWFKERANKVSDELAKSVDTYQSGPRKAGVTSVVLMDVRPFSLNFIQEKRSLFANVQHGLNSYGSRSPEAIHNLSRKLNQEMIEQSSAKLTAPSNKVAELSGPAAIESIKMRILHRQAGHSHDAEQAEKVDHPSQLRPK